MKTSISRQIDITSKKASYDANVKCLLAEKIILAHILSGTVPEFAGMPPEQIVPLIEGEPDTGKIPVYPGETNLPGIVGISTEDAVIAIRQGIFRI